MDNKIFNVNGLNKAQLINTLKLACEHETYGDIVETRKIKGWQYDIKFGLILLSYVSDSNKDANKFIAPLSYEAVGAMAWEWLQTDDAKAVTCEGWDADADHDGDNELGWRVYVEEWGHVGHYQSGVICAVKPAYLWYGK